MKNIVYPLAGACLLVLALFSGHGWGVDAVAVNVDDLATADVIFTGRCISQKTFTSDDRIQKTTSAFQISKDGAIKGIEPGAETIEITQVGSPITEPKRLGSFAVIPACEGNEVMLFLRKSNGLYSTIGFEQGRFRVTESPDGKKQAVNAHNNKGLFLNIPKSKSMTKAFDAAGIAIASPPAAGPLDYDSFVRLVKEMKRR